MRLAPRPLGYFNGQRRFIAAVPRRGLGALNTADPTLETATNALLTELNTNGCQQKVVQPVSDFQTAWNNAGGAPTINADGFYGATTAAALQSAIDSGVQAVQVGPVVAGCVQPKPTTTSGGTTVVNNTPSPADVTVDTSGSATDVIPLAIAGVVGAGLIGWALYAKKGVRWRTRHAH
jgi:hypothetical protein